MRSLVAETLFGKTAIHGRSMSDGLIAATLFTVQLSPRLSLKANCACRMRGSRSSDVTYTRCAPGMHLLGTGTEHGVGPPTRTWTSPRSRPDGSLGAIGRCTKVRPPSSERANLEPVACHAT